MKVLITGHVGLVGSVLATFLNAGGIETVGLDLRGEGVERGDFTDRDKIRSALEGCDGVVHLAAVSRVVWGQKDPFKCYSTNVGGIETLLSEAAETKPWLIFGSSREVYGEPKDLPVPETAQLHDVNIYGRTKIIGERLVREWGEQTGCPASIIRLSNVFGLTSDHRDRVVPAFAFGAVAGENLRVDGFEHVFDFTEVHEVTRGIATLVELISRSKTAPDPIHFVTGVPTTLLELADKCIRIASSNSQVTPGPERHYDVAKFYGDPSRAREILGWSHDLTLDEGLTQFISKIRTER